MMKVFVFLSWGIGLGLFALSSPVSLRADEPVKVNVIRNGGFEELAEQWASGKMPVGWVCSWAPTPLTAGEITVDKQEKYEGDYSLKFSNSKHGAEQRIPVKAGERYDFSCYFKSGLTKGACGLQVQWLDANCKIVKRDALESEKGKPWLDSEGKTAISHNCNLNNFQGWKKVEFLNILVPDTAVTAYLMIFSINANGDFWVDKVEMMPVSGM
jgi:hypothetical protein